MNVLALPGSTWIPRLPNFSRLLLFSCLHWGCNTRFKSFPGLYAPIIFFFFQFWHDSFFIFICLFHSDVTGPSTTDDHNDVTTSSKTGDNNVVGSSTNDVTDLSNDVASGNITDVTEKGDVKSPGTKQWSSEQNSVVENFWKKI